MNLLNFVDIVFKLVSVCVFMCTQRKAVCGITKEIDHRLNVFNFSNYSFLLSQLSTNVPSLRLSCIVVIGLIRPGLISYPKECIPWLHMSFACGLPRGQVK